MLDGSEDLLSKIPNNVKRSSWTIAWSRIKLALSLFHTQNISPNHDNSIKPYNTCRVDRCLLTPSSCILFVVGLVWQVGRWTLAYSTLDSNYVWGLAQRRLPRRIYIQVKLVGQSSPRIFARLLGFWDGKPEVDQERFPKTAVVWVLGHAPCPKAYTNWNEAVGAEVVMAQAGVTAYARGATPVNDYLGAHSACLITVFGNTSVV